MTNKRPVASLNTPEYDALVETVREARLDKGISQRKLAALLGHSTTFVLRIEQKERRMDIAEFLFLAKALEINPNELFAAYTEKVAKLGSTK